ncbi:DNA topoisomerase IV subunit A [Clostridium isatidis]|uniref:DNA topoisomerase (ATP-hydrolyzing) n=1 Tax=Clostridium isatidis TaxID=182773 RepID=A0A343JC92_9CLOT|nr:DNA topoisomerase IV subunit A [Clostridium isatidis]ASW43150.1 DNA topoisomerase IV [Clostridium isatidis]
MAKKVNNIPKDNNIIKILLEEAMPDNYLPYAIEVAKDRALPDVRDGLKPVHRRILYGAYKLKAFPDKPYYKSARIVGDILGKYHPHGDTSVYDAMVILSQDFSTKEPLIDGHGNWGSMDGDGAAAMRYTEARLSPIALEMLRDIEKDVVDMVPNYSDTEMEPTVLPSKYPNLLVNGSFGIAVGLATNIPPHNLKEVIEGVLAYIDNNEITTKELMQYVKGPDLPTGGILIGEQSLLSAYETGEGKVTLRAKTSIEKLENGRWGIVITEFPFRRNKAKLLQTISEMTGDKKHSKALEAIIDIRDESDRNGIRAVIELKKSADKDIADKVLKYLFKRSDLQCNLSFNMVALADGKPQTMGLKTIIHHYVNHQKEIITRRTKKELENAERRFHIVEGFIKAIDVLDEVIKTIRESKSKKDAGINLMNKFNFTEIQTEAILELMLYRLTGLEIKVFKKEYNELEKLIKKLRKILSDERELFKVIKTELKEIAEKYGSERKTAIVKDDEEAKIDIEELIVVEDVMITLSKEGFIKRISTKAYNRANSDAEAIEYREGDELRFLIESNTTHNLLLFTNKGNMYQAKVTNIVEGKWKEKGERIEEFIKSLNLEEEKIVEVFSVDNFMPNRYLQFVTSKGGIKKSSLDNFQTNYSKLQALKLKADDELVNVIMLNEEEEKEFIKIKTKLGLSFDLELPKLENQPRNILPLSLFNLAEKDEVIEAEYTEKLEYIEFNIGVNNKGVLKSYNNIKIKDDLKVNTDTLSELLLFTNKGNVIKIPAFMIKGVLEREIPLSIIIDNLEKNEKIIKLISLKEYDDIKLIYLFTKKGMVKKTYLSEFEGNYLFQTAYKFKFENDEVISVSIHKDEIAEILMITKKGMGIKFLSDNINPMGKVAAGVTGISLKENDEVIYGNIVSVESGYMNNELAITSYNIIKLITKNKKHKEVEIDAIKLQNRAGKGSSFMAIDLGDEIKEIIY